MKHLWLILFSLILCGCAAEPVLETVADEWVKPVMAQPAVLTADLPGEAALPVLQSDAGRLYVCQDYEISIQTLSAGDLNETVQTLTGFDRENLTILETRTEDIKRYEFVWACAGETGGRMGRAVVLDDGNYHYCLSALREEDGVSQINWDQVFASVRLA